MIREILNEKGYGFYIEGDTPKDLADKTLDTFFQRRPRITDLPINPYKIMVLAGAFYVILDFDKVEGYFVPPGNNEKFSKIGLKLKTLPERRRFSAAHELCHHLKDSGSRITKQESNDPVEIFANQFATHLLMPENLVLQTINEFEINKEDLDLDKVLKFALRFAVSFRAAFIRLNEVLNIGLTYKEIKDKTDKYKPNKKKEKQSNYDEYVNSLYSEIIADYHFLKFRTPVKTRNDFLRLLITNDHLIENGNVSKEKISQIIALLRVFPPNEIGTKCTLNKHEIEVVGQYLMYEYIFDSEFQTEMKELKKLHEKFCAIAPHPEYGGRFRGETALITGSSVTTSPPHLIEIDLIDLFYEYSINNFIEVDNISIIKTILAIHHGITVIHPFQDGNGRISRALMNFQFIKNNISPFFVSYEKAKKKEYYEGLHKCDENKNNCQLETYTYKNIIEMYSKLLPTKL